jgi:hypothetical protein
MAEQGDDHDYDAADSDRLHRAAAALLEGGGRRMRGDMWWRGYLLAKQALADHPQSDEAKTRVAYCEMEQRTHSYYDDEQVPAATQNSAQQQQLRRHDVPPNNNNNNTPKRDPRLEVTSEESRRDVTQAQAFRIALGDLEKARCIHSPPPSHVPPPLLA